MDCALCKGRLERGSVPFTLERNGYHITWDAVPAWVCTQCGEPMFDEREVEVMQVALSGAGGESPAA